MSEEAALKSSVIAKHAWKAADEAEVYGLRGSRTIRSYASRMCVPGGYSQSIGSRALSGVKAHVAACDKVIGLAKRAAGLAEECAISASGSISSRSSISERDSSCSSNIIVNKLQEAAYHAARFAELMRDCAHAEYDAVGLPSLSPDDQVDERPFRRRQKSRRKARPRRVKIKDAALEDPKVADLIRLD